MNFADLNRNIVLNGFSESVKLNSIAITDESRFSTLNVYKFTPGGNFSQFDEEIDSPLMHRQGVFGVSLDELCLIWKFPFPNYIKIDVDGIEMKILKGAKRVLTNPSLKSVLIELRKNEAGSMRKAIQIFEDCGFTLINQSDRKGQDINCIFSRL